MTFEKELLDLDYLVYSSHKTGTQTLRVTLNNNGFQCRHCHVLKHIGLKNGSFREYLEHYSKLNHRKLKVISVFREPMERHISSFFQGYGDKPLRLGEVEHKNETIIYQYSIEKLQELFISELNNQSLIGFPETLHSICQELQIRVDQLNYDCERRLGLYESENIQLYIFRFDVLFENFTYLLKLLTGKNIYKSNINRSDSKWYKNRYSAFKASLVMPYDTISKVYEPKRDIIKVLYSDNFESILNQAFVKYGLQ